MSERAPAGIATEVAELAERLFREYQAYCFEENADPEGFVERLEAELESIRLGSRPDPVAAEAIPAVLQRIVTEGEGQAP